VLRCAAGLFAAAFYGALAGALVATLPAGPAEVVRAVVVIPFSVLGAAFATVTYAGLRRAVDGAGVSRLAAELDG
jgi:hypothetical protein